MGGGMSRDASLQSGADNEHVARVIANSRVARQNLRCEGADSIALCVVPVPDATRQLRLAVIANWLLSPDSLRAGLTLMIYWAGRRRAWVM